MHTKQQSKNGINWDLEPNAWAWERYPDKKKNCVWHCHDLKTRDHSYYTTKAPDFGCAKSGVIKKDDLQIAGEDHAH